jgi:hypothetical protein
MMQDRNAQNPLRIELSFAILAVLFERTTPQEPHPRQVQRPVNGQFAPPVSPAA